MSAATIAQYLAPERARRYPAGSLSSTKPGTMLRSQIDIRWAGTQMAETGFFEVDTVAHCGHAPAW